MSTFWHKMSDLKPVCSVKMWKLTEKSYFCALSVMYLRLVCILKLEGLLQGYVKWKNTMTCNVNFLTQNVGSVDLFASNLYVWYWPKNHIFVPSPLCLLRLVCILKLEGLLQGYVNWKNTMTGNVNFLTQNVGSWNLFASCLNVWYWPKNHIFVPSPLCFWG